MSSIILEAKSLTKEYKQTLALEDYFLSKIGGTKDVKSPKN